MDFFSSFEKGSMKNIKKIHIDSFADITKNNNAYKEDKVKNIKQFDELNLISIQFDSEQNKLSSEELDHICSCNVVKLIGHGLIFNQIKSLCGQKIAQITDFTGENSQDFNYLENNIFINKKINSSSLKIKVPKIYKQGEESISRVMNLIDKKDTNKSTSNYLIQF